MGNAHPRGFELPGTDVPCRKHTHKRNQGLKGVSADIVILEEAGRIDDAVLLEVCAPLLMVEHTSLLAISTPVPNSIFSNLVQKKACMFNVLDVRMVCEACAAKDPTLHECKHNRSHQPPWKQNQDRADLVRTIMESDMRLYRQENLGIDQGTAGCVFSPELVQSLCASRDSVGDFKVHKNRLFCAVDPNGGSSSRFGILFGCYTQEIKLMLLFGKACEVSEDGAMVRELQQAYAECTRLYPSVACCDLVTIVESNYGGQVMCSRICAVLSALGKARVLHVRDHTGHRAQAIGVTTTNESKDKQCIHLAMCMRTDYVRLHERMSAETRATIQSELSRFRVVGTATGRRRITGKDNGCNDDLGICVLLLAYWSMIANDADAHLVERFQRISGHDMVT